MSERTIIAVVSDMRRHGLTVELQILVDELIMLCADLQAKADAREGERAGWRERKRMSREVTGSHVTPHTPRDNKIKNKITPNPPLETDFGFQAWYEVFPRREARRGAEKAYRHALKRGATPEQLLVGAKRYASAVSGREPQFVKMPAAWLNQDCWLDEGKVISFGTTPPKRSWQEIQAERNQKEAP